MKNNDPNPEKLINQVTELKQDVIDSSNSDSISQTANELLGRHDDFVRVLGSAFGSTFIEKDANKGILASNHINSSSSLFGVQAADVFQIIQKFMNQSNEGQNRSFK